MKYLYSFNSHSDFYNKHMVLEDDNVVLCKDTDINKWHGHYQHPPYDAEIEYLESTATQYIDTGVVGNSDLSIVLKCYYPASSASLPYTGFILGSRVANADKQYAIIHSYGSNFRYGNVASNNWENPTGRVLIFNNTEKHNVIKVYDTENNLITTLTATAATFNNNLNIILFGINNNGTIGKSSNKIYSLKMYEGTTLVRDFISVRVGNKGYMYDKVSGQLFGNAGTGNFILGPDIQPIEYLESTGTQYIDTGVIMNQSSSIEIDFQMTDLASTSSIFGGREGYKTKDFSWMYISSEKKIRRNYGTLEKYSGTYDTVRRIYIHNGRNLINNGAIFDTFDSQTFECPVTTYLFSINNNGATINTGKLRIYGCKITGKNKTMNLIPVRVGNVGYMYDRISGQLFGNAGTGSFTLGNDL